MHTPNKARIYWACRRGMRELDIAIMSFFVQNFDALDNQNKQRFTRLLKCDDLDLFNWLINHSQPDDRELQQIISIIQMQNKARGSLTM